MKPKTALKTLAPLLEASSFTSKEARTRGVSPATLNHYIKAGDIERLARGIYRHAEAPSISDVRWEDLAKAAQAIRGGVVCLISALALYDVTEEMPREYWIAITNVTSHKRARNVRLVRMRNMTLGKTSITIEKVKVPIFDLERTIVDTFRLLDKEIAIKALKMAVKRKGSGKLNLAKLQAYAKKLKVPMAPYILSVTT
jgi:predicted transcriptional regulator of viral defense system